MELLGAICSKLVDGAQANWRLNIMDRKLCSVLLVLFLTIGVTGFAQDHGQNRGPGGGLPPAVSNQHIEHGGGDHGPKDHGQANKPSEPNGSLNAGKNDPVTRLNENPKL